MLKILNYEELFRTQNGHIVPITELLTPKAIQQYINELCSKDTEFGFVASCKHGCTTGNFLEGTICPICHTEVTTCLNHDLRYKSWIGIPEQLPPILHPLIYFMLTGVLGNYTLHRQRVSIIDRLLNSSLPLPPELNDLPTGMENFYTHFDMIMDRVLHYAEVTKSNPTTVGYTKQVINKYRKCIFTRVFPLLDPIMHMISSYGVIKYHDEATPFMIELLNKLSSIIHTLNNPKRFHINVNDKLFLLYKDIINYVDSILRKKTFNPNGIARQHIFGSRMHCTARGVIVPITKEHESWECHLPWQIGVLLYKMEIFNILINRFGMDIQSVMALHTKAITEYVPLIDRALNILIDEHLRPGLPIIINRNPSIRIGALTLLFVPEIKTDIHDTTIGVPSRNTAAANADFDGDNENIESIKENAMVTSLENIQCCVTMVEGDKPGIEPTIALTDHEISILEAAILSEPVPNGES